MTAVLERELGCEDEDPAVQDDVQEQREVLHDVELRSEADPADHVGAPAQRREVGPVAAEKADKDAA